jgi:CLIP-associating protein 1/2
MFQEGARLLCDDWLSRPTPGPTCAVYNNTPSTQAQLLHDTPQPRSLLTTQTAMDAQAAELLQALKKTSSNVDQRIQLFSNLKSSIKHNRVPEECQAPIFECIRLAITASTSAALVSTGFSTLSHFVKRLQLQNETEIITSQSSILCSILADKLGDARESHRSAALQILADLHYLCPAEVDALIHDAMKGNNARAKDTSMAWVVKMNKNEGLPFKTYSNQLVANLEDADAGVRDTAKKAVVDLFGYALTLVGRSDHG